MLMTTMVCMVLCICETGFRDCRAIASCQGSPELHDSHVGLGLGFWWVMHIIFSNIQALISVEMTVIELRARMAVRNCMTVRGTRMVILPCHCHHGCYNHACTAFVPSCC